MTAPGGGGAGQGVDGLHCVYGTCQGFPNGPIGCHPGCSFTMSPRNPFVALPPDRIAAAAREVIRSADVYDQNPSLSNNAILRASVVAWRAVREGAKP